MADSLTGADTGLLKVVNNATMVAEEQAARMREEAERLQALPVLQGLAAYVTSCWDSARKNKATIQDRLLRAQNARLGKYDSDKLQKIRAVGGSEEYARVTANKCRVAESWLRDVYLGQSEKPWTLASTPDPDVPDEEMEQVRQQVAQELAQAQVYFGKSPPADVVTGRIRELEDAVSERMRDNARRTVERMERKMHDQLIEGNWQKAWGEFLNDLVTYPAAHFKGPVLRTRTEVEWVKGQNGWEPQPQNTVGLEWERVDPFRCYPSPNATSPQDGFFIEHVTFSRGDLYKLIGLPGYDEGAIRAVLEEYGRGGLTNWLWGTGAEAEEQNHDGQDRDEGPLIDIDGIEYHGPVRGRDLVEWGMDPKKINDIDADYEACVWLVGRWVIKAQLNYDPMHKRPYFKGCWEDIPGSYWGIGLVDALADVQGVVNAAVRALVNNMAMASGPQVAVNVDRLPPGEDITTLTPWKIWQIADSDFASNGEAIKFFQPDANVNEILTVVEKFYQFADDWSLIPRYMSGNDRVGGAGRTASGLSMLLNAANKGLKGIVSNIDVDVLTPVLERLYTYNMLFDEDDSIKGDAEVMARGAVSLMQLETLQLRRNEFLAATANPLDSQIVGLEGRAEILRAVAKGLDMDVNRVVPPRGALSGGQPPAGQQGGQPPSLPGPGNERLANDAAVTDNFSPNSLRAVG